ncbi:MAG: FAD binding domain-containing protein [Hyphomicrobiaceae bacterium]
MKPAPFDYVRPSDIGEVLDLLARHGSDARILAGGQSMMAMLNMRVATPKLLIDIGGLRDLDYIREAGDHIAIGCATRQSTLERWPHLEQKLPLIAKALPWVGHVQTRSRGTVCGSLAHADPSSELPLCLALLRGHVVLRSRRASRVLAAADFFAGALQTTRRDDELIEEVRFPVRPDATGVAFHEMAIRHGDFAIIAVGAVADAVGVSVGVGGGADYPVVKRLQLLEGDALEAALNALAWSLDCQDDLHATAAYRRHLVRGLGQKTIEEAIACRS